MILSSIKDVKREDQTSFFCESLAPGRERFVFRCSESCLDRKINRNHKVSSVNLTSDRFQIWGRGTRWGASFEKSLTSVARKRRSGSNTTHINFHFRISKVNGYLKTCPVQNNVSLKTFSARWLVDGPHGDSGPPSWPCLPLSDGDDQFDLAPSYKKV